MDISVACTLVNGVECDFISVRDRGLAYGDGLFETLMIYKNKPVFFSAHWQRLALGCTRLSIAGVEKKILEQESYKLSQACERGVLKWMITRGEGGRGYLADPDASYTRIVSRFPWPEYPESNWQTGVAVRLCQTRLSINPQLAGLKHLNRLEQVLARNEWRDPDCAEGIMFDTQGRVIEGTMSNLFLVGQQGLITPDLSRCGVDGIVRQTLLSLAQDLNIEVQVRDVGLQEFESAQSMFICNSLIGIWPVRAVCNRTLHVHPIIQRLQQALTAELYHHD